MPPIDPPIDPPADLDPALVALSDEILAASGPAPSTSAGSLPTDRPTYGAIALPGLDLLKSTYINMLLAAAAQQGIAILEANRAEIVRKAGDVVEALVGTGIDGISSFLESIADA